MHTKMSLNVRHRVVSPAGIAERTCIYPNQAQTLARERVTRQPPTLDCGSTEILGEPADAALALRYASPSRSSPPDHPLRPVRAPEFLCRSSVVIAEQATQSLTTSHLPVGTADVCFRFDQRVPQLLMVALSIMLRSP